MKKVVPVKPHQLGGVASGIMEQGEAEGLGKAIIKKHSMGEQKLDLGKYKNKMKSQVIMMCWQLH